MDTFEHISPQFTLFAMLYGGAAVLSVVLCLYLLLSKVNVIAPNTTPPARLRRWAAAFFGVGSLGHLWWYCLLFFSGDIRRWAYVACVVLDCVLMLTTIFGTMLSMLQDRKRPLWPFVTAMMPIAVLGGLQAVRPGTDFLTPVYVYTMAIYATFSIYMAVAVRQYGRWLRDNYADLEHKEVWLSHTLLILFLLLVVIYGFSSDGPSLFLLRIADFVLFGLLLWRVETLPQLEESGVQGVLGVQGVQGVLGVQETGVRSQETGVRSQETGVRSQETGVRSQETGVRSSEITGSSGDGSLEKSTDSRLPDSCLLSNIGDLLKENCEKTGLYLMNDLTLAQLSAAIGINRTYLSQYFSSQGMNYNTYINGLRINHFIRLYQKAVAAKQPVTAQQLAQECGYRSYSTFSTAFKLRMGQSVTAWMHDRAG